MDKAENVPLGGKKKQKKRYLDVSKLVDPTYKSQDKKIREFIEVLY